MAGQARPEGRSETDLKFQSIGVGLARPMKPTVFNFFNLVSYRLYVVIIFEFYVVKIYGSSLGRHSDEGPS
jgi:hypothetical protein